MRMTPEMYKEVIDFVNNTTRQQQMYLIQCIADRITINLHSVKCTNTYNVEDPFLDINLNGAFIDINIAK